MLVSTTPLISVVQLPSSSRPRRGRPSYLVVDVAGMGFCSVLTDDELTRRARDCDSAAYRELARRHRTRMYRSALSMLGSAQDPEDVAHDIATRLRIALAAFTAADPP